MYKRQLQKAVVQTLQIGGICLILAILILTIIVSRITKGLMQVNAKRCVEETGMILFKVLPVVDILVGIMCIGIIYPCIIHE